jgi:hypothetical protein
LDGDQALVSKMVFAVCIPEIFSCVKEIKNSEMSKRWQSFRIPS